MNTLAASDFLGDRLAREGTWVVGFLADWCPFCRRFLPVLSALDGGERFRTGVADVSEADSPLWDVFHLEVIPTVLVFRDGRTIARVDGVPGVGLRPSDLDRATAVARDG